MHSGSANVVLRNNRSLRKNVHREKFKTGNTRYSYELKPEPYNHIIHNPKHIKDIRERLQKEQQLLFKKRVIAFIVISLLLLGLLLL